MEMDVAAAMLADIGARVAEDGDGEFIIDEVGAMVIIVGETAVMVAISASAMAIADNRPIMVIENGLAIIVFFWFLWPMLQNKMKKHWSK